MSQGEQRDVAFDIIGKQPVEELQNQSQLDSAFLKKMEIFCGDDDSNAHLFSKVAHTQTVAGEAVLARMLANPTFDIPTLEKRQVILQALLDNPTLLEQLDFVLQEIKKSEPMLLAYFQKEHPVNEELFKKVYFNDRLSYLNKNHLVLELSTRLSNLFTGFQFSALPLSLACITGFVKSMIAEADGNPISKAEAFRQGLKSLILYFDPRYKTFKDQSYAEIRKDIDTRYPYSRGLDYQKELIAKTAPQTFFDTLHTIDQLPKNEQVFSASTAKGILLTELGIVGGSYGFGCYQAYNEAKIKKDIGNNLQTRLIDVSSFIDHMRTLYSLLQTDPCLASIAENKSLMPFDTATTSNFQKLLNLLNHTTFQGEASFFSLTGRVLAAHKLMNEIKDSFGPFIELVGTIDTYVSIAKLYQQHQQTPAHYCFVEFMQQDKPFIKATEFWNPFIGPNTVVTNNIELGNAEKPNNLILTGPNTGGKSTVIKGLLINILLAQTFGIAPAQQLRMTPFSTINCYLNITDDISAGTSLFKAEVLRAKKLIESIRGLQPHEFSFTIMDEVFSGTSPKEGEEAAYKFAQQLGTFGNSICSIATHFPKLTDLEQEAQYKNYQVTVSKNPDGSWNRPFKLETGKSTINIAMELLEEEGIF